MRERDFGEIRVNLKRDVLEVVAAVVAGRLEGTRSRADIAAQFGLDPQTVDEYMELPGAKHLDEQLTAIYECMRSTEH